MIILLPSPVSCIIALGLFSRFPFRIPSLASAPPPPVSLYANSFARWHIHSSTLIPVSSLESFTPNRRFLCSEETTRAGATHFNPFFSSLSLPFCSHIDCAPPFLSDVEKEKEEKGKRKTPSKATELLANVRRFHLFAHLHLEALTRQPFRLYLRPRTRDRYFTVAQRSTATAVPPGARHRPSTPTTRSSPPISQTWRPTATMERAARASRRRARPRWQPFNKGKLQNCVRIKE